MALALARSAALMPPGNCAEVSCTLAGAAALNPNVTAGILPGEVVRVDAVPLPAAAHLQLVVALHVRGVVVQLIGVGVAPLRLEAGRSPSRPDGLVDAERGVVEHAAAVVPVGDERTGARLAPPRSSLLKLRAGRPAPRQREALRIRAGVDQRPVRATRRRGRCGRRSP